MTEKFLDFSFEKTHSAYMLFYEREEKTRNIEAPSSLGDIDPELLSWIWKDNIQFIRDKQIFDLTYFNFMWILCSKVAPRFTESSQTSLSNVKLATSFLLETFIHSKEKPGLKGWSDLLLDHFDNSREACQWFLDHMAEDSWWLYQILLKCPVQTTRQVRCHGNVTLFMNGLKSGERHMHWPLCPFHLSHRNETHDTLTTVSLKPAAHESYRLSKKLLVPVCSADSSQGRR